MLEAGFLEATLGTAWQIENCNWVDSREDKAV